MNVNNGDNQTGERLPMSGAEATRKGGWNYEEKTSSKKRICGVYQSN